MLTNYHTHCYRCQHADGTEADYINKAIEQGFDILGMSDHVPYPGNKEGFRMDFEEVDDYIATVRDEAEKHKDEIEILVGFESEYLPKKRDYYEELLTKHNAEYLALGQHFFAVNSLGMKKSAFFLSDSHDCVKYAESVVEAMSTGYYAFVAHPDIVGVNCLPWDKNLDKMTDIIIDGAVKYSVPLELNANGTRWGMVDDAEGQHYAYPHYKFWEKVAEAQVPTLICADCHNPDQLLDDYVVNAKKIAAEWGLNVIEVLPLGKNKK